MNTLFRLGTIAALLTTLSACSSLLSFKTDTTEKLNAASQQISELQKQIARTQQAQAVTAAASSKSATTVKSAQCTARIEIPAKYKTEQVKIAIGGGVEKVEVIPAKFKHQNEKILIQDASEKIEIVSPPVYEDQVKKTLVRKGYQTWEKGRGPIEKTNPATGEIMRLINVPAQYRTIKTRVMVKPAVTRTIKIPAQYQEVHKHVIDQPARVVKTTTPIEYKTVPKRTLVSEAKIEQHPIFCETNQYSKSIALLQLNLKEKGYNPGSIDGYVGKQTLNAITKYQQDNELPAGYLTIDVMKRLGAL